MPLLTAFPSVDSVFEWAAEAREGAWRDWWKDEVGSPSCSKGELKESDGVGSLYSKKEERE